jgi:hypothetical protein
MSAAAAAESRTLAGRTSFEGKTSPTTAQTDVKAMENMDTPRLYYRTHADQVFPASIYTVPSLCHLCAA